MPPKEAASPREKGKPAWAPLACVVLGSALQLHGWRGRWIPHDEGTLAGSAKRILEGQLPHRDYDEVYSGGLAYLHAGAMDLWGENLSVLRLVLILPALLFFAPTLYVLARSFARPWPAAACALAAFAWGVPNYPAALPSWFNLMLLTAALACLLRAEQDQRPAPWRIGAGFCIGLSIAIKIAGLYGLAAALIITALQEQDRSKKRDNARQASLLWFHLLSWLLLMVLLLALVNRRLGSSEFAFFVLPPLAAAGLVLQGERSACGSLAERFLALARACAALLLGVMLGLAPLLWTFLQAGALGDLWRGLFVLPSARLEYAAWPPPELGQLIWAVPWAVLISCGSKLPRRLQTLCWLGACACLPVGFQQAVYSGVWKSVRALPILLVIASLLRPRENHAVWRSFAVAVAFCALIQFPFSTPLYFSYVAPLVVLLAAGLLSSSGPQLASLGLGFAILFPTLWFHTGTLADFGWGYFRQTKLRPLDLSRGSLQVPPGEAELYSKILARLDMARPGPVFAGPDSPELAFLSGRSDATQGPFAFFGEDASEIQRLEGVELAAAIIHTKPPFSPPYSAALQSYLGGRFSDWQQIGPFLVGIIQDQ